MSPRHHDVVLAHPELADLDAAERRDALEQLLIEAGVERVGEAARDLSDFIDRFGVLTPLMNEDGVTDVLVNGPHDVWVEKHGVLERRALGFADAAELRALVDLLVGKSGGRADALRPIADVRLADGSRLHVVLPPIAPGGPIVSIRRFPAAPWSLAELVTRGTLGSAEARDLASLVRERANIAIAGATGTGKTTVLNALLDEVPRHERVVTIEETRELDAGRAHLVSLLTRSANVEGVGAVSAEDLVRAALRMRPDRIVVGEVRGAEAMTAVSAMTTGHEGSMVTVHARSADTVVDRLVGLALGSPSAPSEETLRGQVVAAFDVVVWLKRAGPQRRVAEIRTL